MNFDGENGGDDNPQNDFSAKVFEDIMFFLLHFFVSLFAFFLFSSMVFLALPKLQRKRRNRDKFGVFYFRRGNSLEVKNKLIKLNNKQLIIYVKEKDLLIRVTALWLIINRRKMQDK